MKENVKENCKEAIKEQLERNNYLLHKIEGFDPYDYLEPVTDWSTGENIVDPETGAFKMYLPVRAQVTWFRLKNPLGKIVVEKVESPSGYVCFEARIYASQIDEKEAYLAIAYAEKAKSPDAAFPAFETCQTAAIGRALTFAGYGCEVKSYVSGEQFTTVPSPTENEVQVNAQTKTLEKPETVKPKVAKPKAAKGENSANPLEIFIQKATKDSEEEDTVKTKEEDVKEKEEEIKIVKEEAIKVLEEVNETECQYEQETIKIEEGEQALGDVLFEIIEGTVPGNISLHVGQSLDEIKQLKPALLQMISKTQHLRDCVPEAVVKAIDEYIKL